MGLKTQFMPFSERSLNRLIDLRLTNQTLAKTRLIKIRKTAFFNKTLQLTVTIIS
jgi:hypothetical protein